MALGKTPIDMREVPLSSIDRLGPREPPTLGSPLGRDAIGCCGSGAWPHGCSNRHLAE